MLTPRATLIATGIRETSRAARLVPGTRPLGILTTGALQDYVHFRKLVPFRRPLIVGSELVTMSALLTCRSVGIRPVAVVEDEATPRVGYPIALFPRLLGLPVYYRTTIDDIIGQKRVEGVSLRHANGETRMIHCDGMLFTGRFTPEASMARMSGIAINGATGGPKVDAAARTTMAGVFAAGNVLRAVHTAGQCWSEGKRAAHAIAAQLQGTA